MSVPHASNAVERSNLGPDLRRGDSLSVNACGSIVESYEPQYVVSTQVGTQVG